MKIDITEIDPLLELVNDPVSFIRAKYYATENERVLAARKQAYSQGFETAIKTNRTNIWRRGYNAGRNFTTPNKLKELEDE